MTLYGEGWDAGSPSHYPYLGRGGGSRLGGLHGGTLRAAGNLPPVSPRPLPPAPKPAKLDEGTVAGIIVIGVIMLAGAAVGLAIKGAVDLVRRR